MTARTAARRYAAALFDVAKHSGAIDAAERELDDIRDLVASHADLRQILETPAVPPQKKRAIVESLFAAAGEGNVEVRRLTLMLADRDRLVLLPDIAAAFAERVMQARRIVPADVVTAVALDDASRAALAKALGAAAGGEVRMTERVDPSIIGGVIARVGSVVFDGSVTRQIERMKQQLLADA